MPPPPTFRVLARVGPPRHAAAHGLLQRQIEQHACIQLAAARTHRQARTLAARWLQYVWVQGDNALRPVVPRRFVQGHWLWRDRVWVWVPDHYE